MRGTGSVTAVSVVEVPGVVKGIRARVGSTAGEADLSTFDTGVGAAGFSCGIQVTYGGGSGIGVGEAVIVGHGKGNGVGAVIGIGVGGSRPACRAAVAEVPII